MLCCHALSHCMVSSDPVRKNVTAEDLEARVATGFIKVYDGSFAGQQSAGPECPIMDETKPNSAPASTDRNRLAGIIMRYAKGRAPLLAITMALCALMISPVVLSFVRSEVDLREILALALVFALGFLVLFASMVVLPGLMEWSGFGEWARRRGAEQREKRFAALGEAHKAPFQFEQRCKLSPTEEVWVRNVRNPQSNGVSLEVLQTRNGCQTWERLPLRLSPWARFKCIMYQGEWPATPRTRHLSCDKDGISFEVFDWCDDNSETWPIVWRAIYRPRWKWWSLKVIGPPWPGTLWSEARSEGTGAPTDPSRPKNA